MQIFGSYESFECDYCACFTDCKEDENGNMQCKNCASKSTVIQESAKRYTLNAKRAEAKKYKLKALTGTQKQKSWAEDIRRIYICEASEYQNFKQVFNGSTLLTAKFWIENRHTPNLVKKIFNLVEYATKLNEGNTDATLRQQYEALAKELCV